MNNYEEVADKAGLTSQVKERYIKYMRIRWANEEKTQCLTGYAMEWAQRFKSKMEYPTSDPWGQKILAEMDKKEEEIIDPEKIANDIFNLFLKETEDNKKFRDALRGFIDALERREDEWLKTNLS